MIISGLLLTLSEDARLADGVEAALRARSEFTLAERSHRWLPVVIEVEDVRASRDLHEWLNALPGVDFVDVVQVNFEEGTVVGQASRLSSGAEEFGAALQKPDDSPDRRDACPTTGGDPAAADALPGCAASLSTISTPEVIYEH